MWILITTDDVKTRLAGAEYTAYTQKVLAPGQADPLPEITRQVAQEVRGYVAAHKVNVLGSGTTIPEELLAAAVDMVVFRMTTRLGLPVKEDRRTANSQAKTLLSQVARGEFAIVGPETAAVDQVGGPGPGITPKVNVFQPGDADGL